MTPAERTAWLREHGDPEIRAGLRNRINEKVRRRELNGVCHNCGKDLPENAVVRQPRRKFCNKACASYAAYWGRIAV
jgi:hypothetical protein